ncbi:sodium- and chloride-dependent betaine transporter-like isoform X2 [Cynoglossus semilaevis]|uniref:sodium- and chloride-dependent betaine transporter-like isoform X2 n=1 Tax=Cynoglossus semilaevis TaxID=244447 RepID=UPI0007DC83D5|nr:sodium- and chloride-dependent betaine transporter-like isoform X2 [Cynoglossus semilaevis]
MELSTNPEKKQMKNDIIPAQFSSQCGSRGEWANKKEFILAVIGEIIGLGNVWRFPYLCFKNGGGAFLIPYFLFLFTCGIPIFFLEMSMGQMTGQGAITCWRKICPLIQGLGYGSQIIMLYTVMYYIVILAWGFFYLFSSFSSELPWVSCNNTWNTGNCVEFHINVSSTKNLSQTVTSSVEEFWQRKVLGLSDSIEELGGVHWDLAGCLLLSWVVCYFCIWKGVKSSGKVVYVTATFPYLMLFVLLIRGLTLPGAVDGITLYLSPDLTQLADPQAAWFPWGVTTNTTMTATEHRGSRHRLTCRSWSGLHRLPSGGVHDASTSALGCSFLSDDHLSGTGQSGLVTSISDLYPSFFYTGHRRKLLLLSVCVLSFLVGLSMVTEGGLYVFQLFDYYACNGIPLLVFAILESCCIGWVYGADPYYNNIENMIGYRPSAYMKICWKFLTPCVSAGVLLFSMIKFTPLRYNDTYEYPRWALAVGLCLGFSSVIMVPLWCFYSLARKRGELKHSTSDDPSSGEPPQRTR